MRPFAALISSPLFHLHAPGVTFGTESMQAVVLVAQGCQSPVSPIEIIPGSRASAAHSASRHDVFSYA